MMTPGCPSLFLTSRRANNRQSAYRRCFCGRKLSSGRITAISYMTLGSCTHRPQFDRHEKFGSAKGR
jgi:hypothetical protein